MDKRKIKIIIFALVCYLAAASIAYVLFSVIIKPKIVTVAPPQTNVANGSLIFDNSLPRTEECPINGVKYSVQQKNWWLKHRPMGVMIENQVDARPQSGISFADVVYEAVAEGGITRTLNIFYCQDAPMVGPVRSARTYFVDFVSEYGDYPLYAHVGGANASGDADALGQINDYGWGGYNDLNQFSIGFPTYWRDYTREGHDVATEHTMYSTTTKLWQFTKDNRGLTNVDKDGKNWDTNFVPYTFKDEAAIANRSSSQSIHVEFWTSDPAYYVDWTYDKQNNVYKRNNGGVAHIDLDTKKQLTTKNLVILFMEQSSADDGYENNVHLLYADKGTGKAKIFMNGKEIDGKWSKKDRTSRTLLFDSTGEAIKFDRGNIWFQILPLDGVVNVK